MRVAFILIGVKSVNTCTFVIVSLLMLRFGWGDQKCEKAEIYGFGVAFWVYRGVVGVL